MLGNALKYFWKMIFLGFVTPAIAWAPLPALEISDVFPFKSDIRKENPELTVIKKLTVTPGNDWEISIHLEIKNNSGQSIVLQGRDIGVAVKINDFRHQKGPDGEQITTYVRGIPISIEGRLPDRIEIRPKESFQFNSSFNPRDWKGFLMFIRVADLYSEILSFGKKDGVLSGPGMETAEEIKLFIYKNWISEDCRIREKYAASLENPPKTFLQMVFMITQEPDFDKLKDRLLDDKLKKLIEEGTISVISGDRFIKTGGPEESSRASAGKKPETGKGLRELPLQGDLRTFRIREFHLPDSGELDVYAGVENGAIDASGSTFIFKKKGGKWYYTERKLDWHSDLMGSNSEKQL